jgi:hypothetical protein
VTSLTDPLNGRSPRHIALPCSDFALPLQRERNRSQQTMIAWQQRAGPAVHRWSGSDLPRDHGRRSCRARVTRRYAANDGARNVDFECFLGSSGTRLLHAVPLQCHPKQRADKHLRPPPARRDIVALYLAVEREPWPADTGPAELRSWLGLTELVRYGSKPEERGCDGPPPRRSVRWLGYEPCYRFWVSRARGE